jgi:arylsulfatase A-like enzyme
MLQQYRPRPWLLASLLVALCLAASWAIPAVADPGDEGQENPRLVVLVVFDQMRGDYLTKWEKLFDKDGFGRLMREGAWYQNCHYPYCYTLTAAGHTSIVTGCPPNKHGIISNDWYDRQLREEVSAVRSERYPLVPNIKDENGKFQGAGPDRRKQPSVGDMLVRKHAGKAKVVSLSIKDRAAILMAALQATAVYWFHSVQGFFCTSMFYRDSLHPWVRDFNATKPAAKYFGKDWTRLRPDLNYAEFSGLDDVLAEGIGYSQGRTFPHPTDGGLKEPGRKFYDAVVNSPFGNELLLELAKIAIDQEKLGQRAGAAADLLCLSFSSNDIVGHCYGPDSQEVFDMTLRSDLIIKDLLQYLDARVGKGRYTLVMTADHGVGQIAEVAAAQGKGGGRVPPTLFTSDASRFLQQKFGPKDATTQLPWVEKSSSGWIYLNHGTLREMKLEPIVVERALVEWLGEQPGIQGAYARSSLSAGPMKDDPIGETVRLSYHPDCSGDVAIVLKPYFVVSTVITDTKNNAYRTTHGTPHPFDTHVPLLVFGPRVQPGARQERVTPLSAAAILARALDVPPPDAAEYPVPAGLFNAAPEEPKRARVGVAVPTSGQ